MAVVQNLQKIIENGIKNSSTRTLILRDTYGRRAPVYCLFAANYKPDDITAARMFFEDTYRTLVEAKGIDVFSENVLPILAHVGMWKVTVITREKEQAYSIQDAERNPIENYIGLE